MQAELNREGWGTPPFGYNFLALAALCQTTRPDPLEWLVWVWSAGVSHYQNDLSCRIVDTAIVHKVEKMVDDHGGGSGIP